MDVWYNNVEKSLTSSFRTSHRFGRTDTNMHGVVASLFHALNKILKASDIQNIKYKTDAVQLKQELDEAVSRYFLHEKDADDISMNMYRSHLETIKSRIDNLTKRLVSHANSPGPYVRPNVNQDMDVDVQTSLYQESEAIPLSTQPTYNTQPTQLPITQPTYNAQLPMSTGMGQPSSSNTAPLDYDMVDAEPQNGLLDKAKAAKRVVFETFDKLKQMTQNAEDAAKQAKASLAEATEATREAEKAMKDVEKEAKREEDARLKLQKAEEKLDAAQRATAERAVQAAQKEASKKANEAEKQAAREAREKAKRMEEEARKEANAIKKDFEAQEKSAKNAKMLLDNAKKIERGAKEKAARDADAAVEKAEKKLTALTVELRAYENAVQILKVEAQKARQAAGEASGSQPKMVGARQVLYI